MVLIAATSEPACTSDTAIDATYSPRIAGFKNSSLNSLLPKRASAGVAISVCTPIASGTPPHAARPNSSATTRLYE